MHSDGVVNQELYSKLNPNQKVLFILKETNGYNENLAKFLNSLFTENLPHKKGSNFQMWHTISKWAMGVIDSTHDYSAIDKSKYKTYLRKVAVINLNKKPGGKKSNSQTIRKEALKNKDKIISQIFEINPEYIIACGTYDIVLEILNATDRSGYACYKNKKIIKMRHPNRAKQETTFNELIDRITRASA